MSHFTVLVIGKDPENQLEPFDENIDIPKHSKGNVSEEDKQLLIDFYCTFNPEKYYGAKSEEESELNKTLSFDELYEKYGEKWNDNTWEKNSEGVWVEMSTYNPNSKWDWYVLGGRWRGFFHKKGTDEKFDQLLKGEIDLDRMRKEAEDEAREKYNVVLEIFGGVIPKVDHLWETIIDKENPFFNVMTIEEKLEFYNNQLALLEVKRISKIEENQKKLGWFFDIEEFQCSIEEYTQKSRNNAISTFAVLKDGEWYEKGKMGWWACVSDEKSDWNEEFNKLMDSVPYDELISLYDCHI